MLAEAISGVLKGDNFRSWRSKKSQMILEFKATICESRVIMMRR